MMANDADQKRMVRGHGAKGRRHKAKLEALEDPTIVADVGWQNLPNLGHTHYVLHMCDGATLIRSHYNNRGLFCDLNIIANNKERSFQKPTVANHNSSQTFKLLRYHNIRTRTIASPSQLRNLIQSQNFSIVTASIHCLRLTLHQKLFATHPSP